jgi:acid phosphatase type 7
MFHSPFFLASLLAIYALILCGCAVTPLVPQAGLSRTTESVTVYAAGDIADCRILSAAAGDGARTAALIAPFLQRDPQSRVLTLGDSTYPDGALSEFNDCYGPTWGQFKQVTHPAPGNHEYRTPGAAGYFDYFGAAAGPGRRGYYRFQLGAWQVYSLNSFLEPEQHAAQLDWLKKELAEHPAQCTMAYWHHPLFSSGEFGSQRMRGAWDILHDAGADLVLAGHDHLYERFAPQDGAGRLDRVRGITQFVVGTGGAELLPVKALLPTSVATTTMQFGVLKLTLRAAGFDWQFLSAGDGAVHDSGAQDCH